jgi:hypothetical protein
MRWTAMRALVLSLASRNPGVEFGWNEQTVQVAVGRLMAVRPAL